MNIQNNVSKIELLLVMLKSDLELPFTSSPFISPIKGLRKERAFTLSFLIFNSRSNESK